MKNKFCIDKKILYFYLGSVIFVALLISYFSMSNTVLENKKAINTRASESKIYNGTRTLSNEFPYFVRLIIKTEGTNIYNMCGGTLIDENYILTARHCTDPLYSGGKSRLMILIGVDNYMIDDQSVLGHYYDVIEYVNTTSIDNIFYPPDNGDIALIKLKKGAQNTPHLSIPPPINSPEYKKLIIVDGVNMTAIGAGYLSDTAMSSSDYLMKTRLVLQSEKFMFSNNKIIRMISDSNGGNTCMGDSGSPLILSRRKRQYIVGLTATGYTCDKVNDGHYTSVAAYSEWITATAGIKPESGSITGDTNMKSYPPQKPLGSLCTELKTIQDCNDNSAVCVWYGSPVNLCKIK